MKKINIPDNFMGIPIEGAMERALANQNTKLENLTPDIQSPHNNLEGFIYIPDIKLYIAKGLSYHNLNWKQAHEELQKNKQRMLAIPEFLVFLKYLRTNQNDQKLKQIYNEITEQRSPLRAEWLDADFKVKNNQLYINSYHELDSKGKFQPKYSEVLEPCLMENKLPGIDLEYWINNHTKQGLPLKNTPDGSLYYRAPMRDDNSVAGFGAISGGANFDCNWDPSYSDASLGVRPSFAR